MTLEYKYLNWLGITTKLKSVVHDWRILLDLFKLGLEIISYELCQLIIFDIVLKTDKSRQHFCIYLNFPPFFTFNSIILSFCFIVHLFLRALLSYDWYYKEPHKFNVCSWMSLDMSYHHHNQGNRHLQLYLKIPCVPLSLFSWKEHWTWNRLF